MALAHSESLRTRLTAPTAQANYRSTSEFIYTAPLSLYLQQGDAPNAFTAAERARCRVLADLLAGQLAQPHANIPDDLLQRQMKLRQQLDQAYGQEHAPASLAELEAEWTRLDREIELQDPTYAALESVDALTADEVRERLPAHSALLTYAGDADDQLWILVVTATDVQMKSVPKMSVRWLHNYLLDHLNGMRRGSLVPDQATGHLSAPHLFPPLYQTLIAPVWEILAAMRTVYIVPFGPLHYLPLGALTPNLETSPPLLAQGRRVVYAPSATILFDYCHTRPPSAQRGVLAMAPTHEDLPASPGAAQTITAQSSGSVLLGSDATQESLIQHGGHHRVVCFLGHAKFNHQYPMSSYLRLADGSFRASDILRELRLDADLVVLAACESGSVHVLRGDEILGLTRAIFYAGTPSILATLWPVHEIPTRLLMEKFFAQLPVDAADGSFDPALVLAATQDWLRNVTYQEAMNLLASWSELTGESAQSRLTELWQMTHPEMLPTADSRLFAHPFFWSPYILIGDQQSGKLARRIGKQDD
ncbi:CHAT domain-containing protein [Chloroflexi bacterium TSY]|nr:CHAT domain-containing protein [Chloroflexi bacterium TSY]